MFTPYPKVKSVVELTCRCGGQDGWFSEGHQFTVEDIQKDSADPWFYLKDKQGRKLRTLRGSINPLPKK